MALFGYSASYTYDANGNRLTRTVGGVTENYAYDDADKLQDVKIGGVTQKSYGYDTAGRTTSVVSSAGTTTLAYDYEGRILLPRDDLCCLRTVLSTNVAIRQFSPEAKRAGIPA